MMPQSCSDERKMGGSGLLREVACEMLACVKSLSEALLN